MRLNGWERRLQEYLDSIGPFEWGKTDCCMFSLGRICEILTGINHLTEYKYASATQAARILKRLGGIEALAQKHLGESKSPLQAQRGDIVMFDSGNGPALGVCIGAKIAAMQADGLIYLPMSQAIKAWSV